MSTATRKRKKEKRQRYLGVEDEGDEARRLRNRIRRGKEPRFTTAGRLWQNAGKARAATPNPGVQPRGLLGRRGDIKFSV